VGPREMISSRNLSTEGRAANLLAGIDRIFYLVYCAAPEKDIHQIPDIYLENIFNTAGIITTVTNASGSKVMLH